MIKTLLTSVALLALSLSVNAQTFESPGKLIQFAPASSTAAKAPAKVQGTIDFSYFTKEYTADNYGLFGLGSNSKAGETYDVAIQIPSAYAGCKVKSVSFVLYDASILSDVKAWAGAALPSSTTSPDVSASVASPVDYTGINTVNFENPYTIPEGGCYVGYSFTVTTLQSNYQNAAQYPVIIDGDGSGDGGFFLRTSTVQTSWFDTKSYGYTYEVTTMATLEGDFSDNEAFFGSTSLGSKVAAKDQASTATVAFNGKSITPITSLAYTVKDVATGKVSEEATVTGLNVKYGASGTFDVALDAESVAGSYEKQVTLTKVNGVENVNTGNVGTLTLRVLAKSLARKVVEEEFTTTDCGWCPRGIAGMDMLAKTSSDKWIGIAAHGYTIGNWLDPMFNYDYYFLPDKYSVSGYPSCHLNRSLLSVDPYYGTGDGTVSGQIKTDVEEQSQILPEGAVKVSAEWTSDDNIVNVTAETEFALDYDNAPFALAFVLIGNGLTGTTDNWTQANYYYYYASYYSDDEYLKPWTERNIYATGIEFNHVALATKGIDYGIEGSITSPAKMDTKQTYTTTFDLSNGITSYTTSENLIQDKSKLQVVAILMNTETGEIVNGDECDITGLTTGISIVNNDGAQTEVSRYNVNGQQVSAPVKGINLVKMADGKTRKVVVK